MNDQFISGEWYDKQYGNIDSRYGQIYNGNKGLPQWAIEANQHHVDMAIAILSLDPLDSHILDIGSGMGYFIDAWENRGYTTSGIDISEKAIELSGRKNIICSSATDLSMFPDNHFDVVMSASFLEHVDKSQERKAISEFYRVGKRCVHYIAHEVGGDPSHINIKPPLEWQKLFDDVATDDIHTFMIPNRFHPDMPMFIQVKEEYITWPLANLEQMFMKAKS